MEHPVSNPTDTAQKSLLTDKAVQRHIMILRVHCDPKSPFYGMIEYRADEGLLALPVHQQWQVYNALPPDLKEMVDTYMGRNHASS
jgi:hypothetical protein